MWAFVNWIQIIRLMTLLETNVTTAFSSFLNEDMQMFNLQLPMITTLTHSIREKLQSFVGDSSQSLHSEFEEKCREYDIEVGSFLIYIIVILMTLSLLLLPLTCLFLLGKLLKKMKFDWIINLGGKIVTFAVSAMFFNSSIRLFQE